MSLDNANSLQGVTRRGLFAVVASAVGGLALEAVNESPLKDPRVRAIGEKLICQCGCRHSVTHCDMLRCSFSDPARAQIKQRVDEGWPEQKILDEFVDKVGLKVLQAPPTDGFNVTAWTMPFVGLGAFSLIMVAFINKMRKPTDYSPPAMGPVDNQAVERYEQIIDRDLEN